MASTRRRSRRGRESGINLTPLLDCIFNLMFFFILATTLRESPALNVDLPKSGAAETPPEERLALVVAIAKDNTIVFRDQPIAREALAAALKEERERQGTQFQGVVVLGDQASQLQAMIDVMTACKEAGVRKVDIRAQRPQTSAPALPPTAR